MRIVLLNQYYAPDEAATAQMLGDLGEGLAAAGCEVIAVCCDRSYADPSRRYPARETIGGVSVRRVRRSGFGRGSRIGRITDYATFLAGAKIALLFGPRPDVVISLSTPPLVSLLGSVCARIRGARSVFWSMDVYPDVAYALGAIRERSIAGRVIAMLARLTHTMPDTVVALGETMAKRLEAGGARNVSVIHNWADEDAIRPTPVEGHPLRKEWGWDGKFVVMYSGNMGLAHEFGTVVGAAKLISNFEFRISDLKTPDPAVQIRNSQFAIRNPPVLFAFVGEGPRKGEIAEASEGLANVEMRGYVERGLLGGSLTAPDVHLVTMREGMQGLIVPSKIYGILAAGKPTIYVGPAEGEVWEILREGECGTRVAIGDVDGLVRAVERYRASPELVAEEGRRARALFERRFTKAIGIARFKDVIGV